MLGSGQKKANHFRTTTWISMQTFLPLSRPATKKDSQISLLNGWAVNDSSLKKEL